jgi:16S rRNA (cytosine967-C5)-methyltransferase
MTRRGAEVPAARRAALEALLAVLPELEKRPGRGRAGGAPARGHGTNDAHDAQDAYVAHVAQDAQAALDAALAAQPGMDERDAALATEVVYGALRLKGRIEHLLGGFLDAPDKLPQALRVILLAAAYEILYLDRVPTYASVNWAVDAVRSGVSAGLAGLTNAVLRRVGQLGNEIHEKAYYTSGKGPGAQESVATWSRFYSCPEWIVRLWREAYGMDVAERLLRAQLSPPALGVAIAAPPAGPSALLAAATVPPAGSWAQQARQAKALLAAAETAPDAASSPAPDGASPAANGPAKGPVKGPAHDPGSLREQLAALPGLLDHAGLGFAFPAGTRLESFLDSQALGALSRGSFAARRALLALEPASWAARWPGPVWDACSGRGGKARVLRELGLDVRASDPHRGRIRALRAELPTVPATVADALEGPPEELFADQAPAVVLLDAPCSGLGVLSRRPDIKWHRAPGDVADLAALQGRLLDAAARPETRAIAYITCTLAPRENEEAVRRFLEAHADFSEAVRFATPPTSPLGEYFFASLLVRASLP